MAEVDFSDLIPKKGAAPGPAPGEVDFSDLVPKKRQPWTGTVLPVRTDEQGNVSWAVPKLITGAIDSLKSAATLPKDVYEGRVDPRSEKGFERVMDLAGVAVSPSPAYQAAAKTAPAAAPTREELRRAGGKAFDDARAAGVVYDPNGVKGMTGWTRAALRNDGLTDAVAPKTMRLLADLEQRAANGMQYTDLAAQRKAFGKVSQSFTEPAEQEAARRVMKELDSFITSPPPGSVVGGDAAKVAKLHSDGNANYAASRRSDAITSDDPQRGLGVTGRAELNADGANSGFNLDNNLRQRVKSLLTDRKNIAGFSKTEIAALEAVNRGTAGRNTLRIVTNMLGGGGGLGGHVSATTAGVVGTTMFGPVGGVAAAAAVPLSAMALKTGQNRMAMRAVNEVDELVRRRAPLFSQRQWTNGRAPVQGVPQSVMWQRLAIPGLLGDDEERR